VPGQDERRLRLRVLVADADPETRGDLAEILVREGNSVTAVPSSSEARRALEQGEFDLLFVQIRPARVNAMGLLAEARYRWPRLLVVVLVDGGSGGSIEQAVLALHQGALDYLRKPVLAGVVLRVLDLAMDQLSLTRVGQDPVDPLRYAGALATRLRSDVLLAVPGPSGTPSDPRVSVVPLLPEEPLRLTRAVEEFLRTREKGAVVMGGVEELFSHHREEEVARFLEGLRSALEGKGPLVVGYDPARITATGALAVRASIVSTDAHATLGALSSPIRRRVLRRLVDGPTTFSQALEAAGLEDTSKIAFHLRKLRESGLITHLPGKRYHLTERGRGAVQVLNLINELDPGEGSGNRTFPSTRALPSI
jgi:CheY-like chemotaxis protein